MSSGRLFCRRPVLTDPAPPPRRALRPDPPVVCSGFGFDKKVYIGTRLFVFPKKCPGQLSRGMFWEQKGRMLPWRIGPLASRPGPARPDPPRRPAVRRPAPKHPWYNVRV